MELATKTNLWLYIAMGEPFPMHDRKTLQHLSNNVARVFLGHALVVLQVLLQIAVW